MRFKQFGEFTLTALQRDPARYGPLTADLQPLLAHYGAQVTAGGAGAGKAETRSVETLEAELRGYVRRLERKHIGKSAARNSTRTPN